MIKDFLEHFGFKWMSAGFILGAVLGICFFILLRPGGGGSGRFEASPELKEGLQQSQKLAAEGKSAEAAKVLENLVARYPRSPEAYNNLAALQASRGQLENSRELLEKALRTNESYAAIYENLGVVYSEIARSSYGKALRLELPPSSPQLKILSHVGPAATTARAVQPAPGSPVVPSVAAIPSSGRTAAPTPKGPAPTATPAAATALPAVSPPPSQEPVRSRKDEEKEMLKALYAWADAWSRQDTAGYLSSYSRKFQPEDGLSRKSWEKQREERIKRPNWIKVNLKNIILTPTGPDAVEVKLVQDYRADTFRDKARKTMTLVREDGAWRIGSENIVGHPR